MPVSDRLLNDAVTGIASAAEFTENMQDIEDVILDITGGMVVSGAIPTAPGGLTLRIPASVYDIGVKRSKSQTDVALTNNSTCRVYAVTDPDDAEGISYVVKTDATVPARSALRCIAVTSGGAITSITEIPGNTKRRVELGLHTITLDQYVNISLPVGSDLLLKWDFSAKGNFSLQDYQVVIDPDDVDQLPTSTLIFVLPVRNPDHFYVYIQNLSDAVAGGYGTANQIRFTPKLIGRGYTLISETAVDVVTPTAVNYHSDGGIGRPSQITSTQFNFALTSAQTQLVNSDAARTIAGITAGFDGETHILVNTGAFTITLSYENGGAATARRIYSYTLADVALAAGRAVYLVYDGILQRWRIINFI